MWCTNCKTNINNMTQCPNCGSEAIEVNNTSTTERSLIELIRKVEKHINAKNRKDIINYIFRAVDERIIFESQLPNNKE